MSHLLKLFQGMIRCLAAIIQWHEHLQTEIDSRPCLSWESSPLVGRYGHMFWMCLQMRSLEQHWVHFTASR